MGEDRITFQSFDCSSFFLFFSFIPLNDAFLYPMYLLFPE